MTILENIVNIKKISDKHNLSLIQPKKLTCRIENSALCERRAFFPALCN